MKPIKLTLQNAHNLENGDILHCGRNSFMSKAIRFVTGSDFVSHTAPVLKDGPWIYIVDSQIDGTRLRHLEEWINKYNYKVIVTRGAFNGLGYHELLEKMEPYLNSWYAYGDILRHVWYKLTKRWKVNKNAAKYLTCSEFVGRLIGAPEAYKITPIELFNYCLSEGHTIPHSNENNG